jgi:aerobic-type carbon monoxide dehydrogenase small subunit (CoxS/CutS family)
MSERSFDRRRIAEIKSQVLASEPLTDLDAVKTASAKFVTERIVQLGYTKDEFLIAMAELAKPDISPEEIQEAFENGKILMRCNACSKLVKIGNECGCPE